MNFDVKFQEESSFAVEMGQLTRGPKGDPGKDGKPGKDGITPTIGENGNWFLGDEDTGKPSRGEGAADAVKFTEQELTDVQKSQARENIGAVGAEDVLQPDWAQNDATAADYVKNRTGGFSTFTEEKVEIQYSGDYADKVYWGNAGGLRWVLAHSSDEIPTKEELAGATYTGTMAPQGAPNVYDAGDKCYYATTTGDSLTAKDPPPYAIVVTEAGTVVWGLTFSKAGVYLPAGNSSGGFSVKIDTLTYMKKTETPHAFPAKYIPPLEPLTVTFTKDDDGNWSADKTFAEVKAAIEAGRFVQAVADNYAAPLPVWGANDQQIAFLLHSQGNNDITQIFASMTPTFCGVGEIKGGLLPLDDTPVYKGKLAEKTDDMTQPVGVGGNGKLWTKGISTGTVDANGNISGGADDLVTMAVLNAVAVKLAAMIPTVPEALKNPNALTIKLGSETITYDGSAAKTVEIADGTEVSY